jgi:magnesium-protoporphyrin O-methyltransferase
MLYWPCTTVVFTLYYVGRSNRKDAQLDSAQHKAQLRRYFDGIGFARWSAIYGDAELSPIRRSIREGHAAMLGHACVWLDERFAGVVDPTALDAGCGTGLFTLALAQRGFAVTATDIAPQMAAATAATLAAAGLAERVTVQTGDLESAAGTYDLVACFDVLIHYPAAPFATMLTHLAAHCSDTLLFTYAPYSRLLAVMHRIGGYFPRSQRRTEIQMIHAAHVQHTLQAAGFAVRRTRPVSRGFYHVMLVEAGRVG